MKYTAIDNRPTFDIFLQSGISVFGFILLVILLA